MLEEVPDPRDPVTGAWSGAADGPGSDNPDALPLIQLPAEDPPPVADEVPNSEPEAPAIPRDPSAAMASTLPPPRRTLAPPVLASEALRKEMTPAEPGRVLLPVVVCATSTLAVSLCLWLVGFDKHGLAVAATFLALSAIALWPMPYSSRAGALAVLSGGGMLSATWVRAQQAPQEPHALGLTGAVLLLGTALQLRAWHRGSVSARVLVALGLGAGALWLGVQAPWLHLSSLPSDPRLSLPVVLPIPFGILLMVSLLAFMDARTTGASGLWSLCLWGWYACFVAAEIVAQNAVQDTTSGLAPGASITAWLERDPALTLSLVTAPLLLPTVGIALAQLLASALSGLGQGLSLERSPATEAAEGEGT